MQVLVPIDGASVQILYHTCDCEYEEELLACSRYRLFEELSSSYSVNRVPSYNKIYLRSFYSKFRFREILFTFSGEWGRYAPVTAAIGHEPSSLRSRRDGHRAPMTLSDTSNHTTNQRCIGDRIVETRFYPHVKNETRMTGNGHSRSAFDFRCAFAMRFC